MTQAESARFVESLLLDLGDIIDIEVVILPPFTAIAKVMESLGKAQNIKVGAQNMHWEWRFYGGDQRCAAARFICALRRARTQRTPHTFW